MRHTLGVVALIAAALPPDAGACPPLEILVPAYQYPTDGTMWATLAVPVPPEAAGVRVTVVLNPDSGPGAQIDPTYVAVVQNARSAGARIVGYVATGYGSVPRATVLAQVQTYMDWYGISGVFLDELDNAQPPSGALAYASQLTADIHAMIPGSVVIGNPGATVPEALVAQGAADVLVTYEDDRLDPLNAFATATPPSWVSAYPAMRFANIVYNVPDAATMRAVMDTARSRHVGMIYVASDTLPNPYDALPAYWNAEVLGAKGCAADFDCSGGLAIADIFAFLNAWFAGGPGADFDGMNGVQVADIFAFLNAWFAGCP